MQCLTVEDSITKVDVFVKSKRKGARQERSRSEAGAEQKQARGATSDKYINESSDSVRAREGGAGGKQGLFTQWTKLVPRVPQFVPEIREYGTEPGGRS